MSAITVLGAGLRIEGDVLGDASVEVRGRVSGSVHIGGTLTVCLGGLVDGDVLAAEARIDGVVRGTVRVARSIRIGSQGRLDGDVLGALHIEPGGVMTGRQLAERDPEASERAVTAPKAVPPRPRQQPIAPREETAGGSPQNRRPRRSTMQRLQREALDVEPPAQPSGDALPAVTDADLWARGFARGRGGTVRGPEPTETGEATPRWPAAGPRRETSPGRAARRSFGELPSVQISEPPPAPAPMSSPQHAASPPPPSRVRDPQAAARSGSARAPAAAAPPSAPPPRTPTRPPDPPRAPPAHEDDDLSDAWFSPPEKKQ